MNNKSEGKPRDRTKCGIQIVVAKQKICRKKRWQVQATTSVTPWNLTGRTIQGGKCTLWTPHKDQGRNEDAMNNERKCSHSTIRTP
jgi:hypothetical protein